MYSAKTDHNAHEQTHHKPPATRAHMQVGGEVKFYVSYVNA